MDPEAPPFLPFKPSSKQDATVTKRQTSENPEDAMPLAPASPKEKPPQSKPDLPEAIKVPAYPRIERRNEATQLPISAVSKAPAKISGRYDRFELKS